MSNSVNRRILNGILTVGWASTLVKLVGLADQIVIARTFGTGPAMDAFNAAWALPSLLTVIFASAIETTFVPIYVQARQTGDTRTADRTFSTLVNLCILLFTVISAIAVSQAGLLLRLSAPGFAGDRFDLALQLTPLLYPLILINVLVSLITSSLNARESFARPSLLQGAVPLVILSSILLFSQELGVLALAAGQLLGFLVQLTVLILTARKTGIRYSVVLDWRGAEVRIASQQLIPVILASTLIHANLFVDQVVASTLPVGQLSALNYALKLLNVPVVVVFGAFSRATLPLFSDQVSRADWVGLRNSVQTFSWFMLTLTGVMTIGAIFLSRPVVGLLFEGGKFGIQSTEAVSATFVAAALGLAPMGLGFVIPRVFNALQRNYVLTAITVFSVTANAGLDVVLGPRLGAPGIALATTLVNTAAIAIQFTILSRALGGFNPLGIPVEVRAWWNRSRLAARAGG